MAQIVKCYYLIKKHQINILEILCVQDYWLGQAAAGLTEAPDELAQRVERTTRAQVQAAAQKLTLDTVYFLKGKE